MAKIPTPPGGGENNPPSDHVPAGTSNPGLARSEQLLLPEESAADFRLLRLGMHEDLRPRGVYETTLVERFIANQWRMQRCAIMEAEAIAHRREYATAWANPRRVKNPPTAGAVWCDDLQFYGAALEKLSKKEYRLSLENARILRQLAQRQKAREAEEEVGTAWEPQVSQMDADEQRKKKPTEQPRISRVDTDEQQQTKATAEPRNSRTDTDTSPHPRRFAAPPPPRGRGPGGEVTASHATERTPQSGNLQNELPPADEGAHAPAREAEASPGEPPLAQIDTHEAQSGGSRQFNLRQSAKSAVPKQYRHTAVGSAG